MLREGRDPETGSPRSGSQPDLVASQPGSWPWNRQEASRAVTGAGSAVDRSQSRANNGARNALFSTMVSTLSQAQVLIALVVAAHAGVLAVRLCFSLYEA